MTGRLDCFIQIKSYRNLGNNLPNKVLAPIPEEGITDQLSNELGSLPSFGGSAMQQIVGRWLGGKTGMKGLQNILAMNSVWTGGSRRSFPFTFTFYAFEDPYREVYLPAKALQMMAVPQRGGAQDYSKVAGLASKLQKGVGKLGVELFWYSAPPYISLIVYSILEQESTEISDISEKIKVHRDAFKGVGRTEKGEKKIFATKSILLYSPKCMIKSLSVKWQGPWIKGKGGKGIYPASAVVNIAIDTLKVASSSDITVEPNAPGQTAQIHGIKNTYTYR